MKNNTSEGKEASPFAEYKKADDEKIRRHFYQYTHDSFSTQQKIRSFFLKEVQSLLRTAIFDMTCNRFHALQDIFSVDSRALGGGPTSHPGTRQPSSASILVGVGEMSSLLREQNPAPGSPGAAPKV